MNSHFAWVDWHFVFLRGRLIVINTYNLRLIQTTMPAKRIFLVAIFPTKSRDVKICMILLLDVLGDCRLKDSKRFLIEDESRGRQWRAAYYQLA
jgi:hypothetical protein